MKIKFKYIEVSQAQSQYNFYIGVMKANDIYRNSDIIRLSEKKKQGNRIQRFLEKNRVDNIAKFCRSKNAIFPTPIVLSLNTDYIIDNKEDLFIIDCDADGNPFEIIDGQHRIKGIEQYEESENIDRSDSFNLSVVLYLDVDQSQAANIFVTINSNQKKVDESTIYELFGIMYNESNRYTVQSFASVVTSTLNELPDNPFYHSIKMLGRKENSIQFISQGTVAKKIVERVSSNVEEDNLRIEEGKELELKKEKIFRNYFINNSPELVVKILINYFSSFSTVFIKIWDSNKYLTKKSAGFSGLMKFLDYLFSETNDLSSKGLEKLFIEMKKIGEKEIANAFETSHSSESVAVSIKNSLIEVYDRVYMKRNSLD